MSSPAALAPKLDCSAASKTVWLAPSHAALLPTHVGLLAVAQFLPTT